MNLALLAACALVAQQVHRVHATQGPFHEIRDAVAAAADGDVVLVAPGQYGYFGVIGKGLTILPQTAGVIRVTGTVRVLDVPAGQSVTLKGLTLNGQTGNDGPLRCASSAGAIRIEDCRVQSNIGYGAYITDCADIALLDFVTTSGLTGLHAVDSNVSLFGGTYVGQSMAGTPFGSPGWPGIEVRRSHLIASGVHAVGGDGGEEETWVWTCIAPAGPGGNAILAHDSAVELLDASLVPGLGGIPWSGYCPPAPLAPPVGAHGATTVTWHAGRDLTLVASSTGHVVGGSTLFVTLIGEVGASSVLLVGPSAARAAVPGLAGALLVGGGLGAVRRIPLGPAPAVRSFSLPPLPGAYDIGVFWLQAMQVQGTGIVLGPPRHLTVLGAGW